MTHDPLLPEIEMALLDYGYSASRFGKLAVGDSAFVLRLRKGTRRVKKRQTREKLRQALARLYEKGTLE